MRRSGGLEEIGLDTSFTFSLTGLDVLVEFEKATAEVDQLLLELGLSDVAADIERVRSLDGLTLTAIGHEYDAVEEQLADEADRTLDELLEGAGTLDDADRLVTSLRVLSAATDARQAISDEFTAFFAAQFSPSSGGSDELSASLEQRAIRAEAERDIRRLAVDGSKVHGSIQTISTSPEAELFDSSVADLLEERLVSQTTTGGDLSALVDDIDSVAFVFAASSDTRGLYFDLVDAAGLDTLEASEELAERADRQQTRALVSMVSLALMSLGIGFAATRAIRQPVRRLANVASRLSGGDSAARFASSRGPVEIRAAGNALDAAAEHLQLAERQAKALADGDLEHPVLSHENAGELGASLQHAVGALATSLQEREEFRRRMTHEATHDSLTGIANRKASLAQLNRALARTHRSATHLAVLFIDLDGFKAVNDTHGHRAGDTVLRTIADRMVNAVRAGDHVGRLGGDEFVVIAEPVENIESAIELAKRLLDELAAPIQCDATQLAVSASIGISMSDDVAQRASTPKDGTELLRDADLAVYKAKSAGRGRIELCDDDLRASISEQADLEKALRNAMVENEFVLHYQPIIKPPEETLHGLEALIRWSRPSKGMVRPDEFIPFAERSDLIVMIDQWVLGAVARQIVAWDAAGQHEGVPVSINISGRHLASADFVDDVMSPLRDNGVDPTRIVIEITESALLDDLDGAASKLQALRSFGIRVAIDDFGTGYTSLAHLKSLPIDILKIDRSFTNDESSSSLAKLIIDTGHLLGATITAEGIETADQAASLTAMGSDELQGYLYGRPEPAEGLQDRRDSRL